MIYAAYVRKVSLNFIKNSSFKTQLIIKYTTLMFSDNFPYQSNNYNIYFKTNCIKKIDSEIISKIN